MTKNEETVEGKQGLVGLFNSMSKQSRVQAILFSVVIVLSLSVAIALVRNDELRVEVVADISEIVEKTIYKEYILQEQSDNVYLSYRGDTIQLEITNPSGELLTFVVAKEDIHIKYNTDKAYSAYNKTTGWVIYLPAEEK